MGLNEHVHSYHNNNYENGFNFRVLDWIRVRREGERVGTVTIVIMNKISQFSFLR